MLAALLKYIQRSCSKQRKIFAVLKSSQVNSITSLLVLALRRVIVLEPVLLLVLVRANLLLLYEPRLCLYFYSKFFYTLLRREVTILSEVDFSNFTPGIHLNPLIFG